MAWYSVQFEITDYYRYHIMASSDEEAQEKAEQLLNEDREQAVDCAVSNFNIKLLQDWEVWEVSNE